MTTMKLAMMPMTSQKYHLRGKTLTSERRKRRERHRSTAYRSPCGVSPGVRPSQRESEGVRGSQRGDDFTRTRAEQIGKHRYRHPDVDTHRRALTVARRGQSGRQRCNEGRGRDPSTTHLEFCNSLFLPFLSLSFLSFPFVPLVPFTTSRKIWAPHAGRDSPAGQENERPLCRRRPSTEAAGRERLCPAGRRSRRPLYRRPGARSR